MALPSIMEEEEFRRSTSYIPREPITIQDSQRNALTKALIKLRPASKEEQSKAKSQELSILPAFNNMNMPLLAIAVQVIDKFGLTQTRENLNQALQTGKGIQSAQRYYDQQVAASLEDGAVEPLFHTIGFLTAREEKGQNRKRRMIGLKVDLLAYIGAILGQA